MAVKLNKRGLEQARKLVDEGRVAHDERDAWSEHHPSAAEENAFIARHGMEEFAQWHLGIDEEKTVGTKGRYRFPYGDFERVHRCAVVTAESRAGQYKYTEIEKAAHRLHEMLDASHAVGSR